MLYPPERPPGIRLYFDGTPGSSNQKVEVANYFPRGEVYTSRRSQGFVQKAVAEFQSNNVRQTSGAAGSHH